MTQHFLSIIFCPKMIHSFIWFVPLSCNANQRKPDLCKRFRCFYQCRFDFVRRCIQFQQSRIFDFLKKRSNRLTKGNLFSLQSSLESFHDVVLGFDFLLNLKSFHMSPFCNPLTSYCVKEDIIKWTVTIIVAIWLIFEKIH